MPDPTTAKPWRQAWTAVLAPSFYLAEWGLVAVTASCFALLRIRGLDDLQIWLIFWGANLLLSAAIVWFSSRTHIDLTLMLSLRRLVEAAARRSPCSGRVLETAIFCRLLIWEGPAHLLLFFGNRLVTLRSRLLFLATASGVQMLLWAGIYALGCEGVLDLVNLMKGDLP